MKLSILTEGGFSIGFGHISRCISLSQAFKEKGVISEFIINIDTDTANLLLKGERYEILNWLENKESLLSMLKAKDIIIIDSYLAGIDVYREISHLAKLAIYIDDNRGFDYYPKGIVVNGAIFAEEIDYPRIEGITYLLGIKYATLRKEFWEVSERKLNKAPESIMVTFGGCDIKNMTPQVLKLLIETYPAMTKNVIIGRGFKNIEEIEKIKDKKTNFIYRPEAQEMKEAMFKSDIAVSAGGQTVYELARIGVPTVVIGVADNQLYDIKGWERAGFVDYAGWWEDNSSLKKLSMFLNRLTSYNLRLEKSKIGRTFIDGRGSNRIADFLLERIS